MGYGGNGLRVRLRPIPGETHRETLREALRFPAILGGFGWSEEFRFSSVETIAGGNFTQATRGRSRRTVDDTESLFLAYDPEWLTVRGVQPREVHEALIRIGRAKEPVQLMAKMEGAQQPLVRMPINLLSMAVAMREGEPDTLYYTVRFEESRTLDVERKGAAKFPLNHFIDANDTLHSLAQKYYGDVKGWRWIAERNHVNDWGQNTPLVQHKRFKLGAKLVIPEPRKRAGQWLGPGPGKPDTDSHPGTIEQVFP